MVSKSSWRLLISAALVASLSVLGSVPAASAATYATPTGLKVAARTSSTVDLTWTAVKNAPRYRIQMATKSDMSGAVYFRVTPNHRQMTGLKSNTKYYFKVRVISSVGGNLSSYTSAVTATTDESTPSSGTSMPAPSGLTSTAHTTDSVSLAWNAVSKAPRYRIQMATNPAMSGATYFRVTPTNRVITGLTKDVKYYFKVRVITTSGGNLSPYSAAIAVTTDAPPPPGGFPMTAPAGLASPDQASRMLSLTWNSVAGASRYRIQLSTNPEMSGSTYFRFTETRAQIAGLTADTKYYLKVRVITDDGANLSEYSGAINTTTRSPADPEAVAPFGLTAEKKTTSEIDLTWAAVYGSPKYEVQQSTSADMSKPVSKTVAPAEATLSDLSANTTYYVRVRAVSDTGSAAGNFTSALPVKTAAATTPQPLRIGSFNVKCANCMPADHSPEEGTWAERRSTVVSTIMGQSPDVIGFQEAAQSWLKDSSGKAIDLSQFEDLRNLLKSVGGNYALANPHRNNCVKSTTPTKCVAMDQGASKGTKVFFNASTMDLLGQGSKKLESACSGCNERYLAWATLRQKSTGKKIFFATTHLEPGSIYSAVRGIQTQQAIAEINARNTEHFPVIVTGDFNSTRYQDPNDPYDKMIASGLVDPLGHTHDSAKISSNATAETRIHANYNSFNGFNRAQRFYDEFDENGNNLDYIFTSPMQVTEWETVVKVDSAGKLTGTIPSDHNMLRATVLLR